MTVFKLTKESVRWYRDAPVLLGGDGASGPWNRNDTLPGTKSTTAGEIVLRALAREARAGDPEIVAEPPEKFGQYCWEYLGIWDEEITRAKLIMKILGRK